MWHSERKSVPHLPPCMVALRSPCGCEKITIWPTPIQTSYFIGPCNLHYLLFSGMWALLCHIFYTILCILWIQIYVNVNFSCCPGVPGPSNLRLLVIFFFSIQPTNPISGNASNDKWKKKGDGLTQKKNFNWLHFFFTWLFLYHKEVSRLFSSTSNIAWQFSYQWNRQHAILPQTQIHMYINLVEQN